MLEDFFNERWDIHILLLDAKRCLQLMLHDGTINILQVSTVESKKSRFYTLYYRKPASKLFSRHMADLGNVWHNERLCFFTLFDFVQPVPLNWMFVLHILMAIGNTFTEVFILEDFTLLQPTPHTSQMEHGRNRICYYAWVVTPGVFSAIAVGIRKSPRWLQINS